VKGKAFITAALCVLAVALAFPAAGLTAGTTVTPTSTVVNADATFTNNFDCSFPLTETITGSYKDTVYYDSAGNAVKEILTAQYAGPLTVMWTNPVSGASLSSHEAAPLIVYYNPDGSFQALQNVGLTFSIPGQGHVLLDVGRIVIISHQGIVFQAGSHQELNGDTSAFCAALG